MEQIGYVAGAFVLFMVVLPLFGFLVGIVSRLLFPYLAGGVFFLVPVDARVATLVALVWMLAVFHTRSIYKRKYLKTYAWHEGHFRAAAHLLSLGALKRVLTS